MTLKRKGFKVLVKTVKMCTFKKKPSSLLLDLQRRILTHGYDEQRCFESCKIHSPWVKGSGPRVSIIIVKIYQILDNVLLHSRIYMYLKKNLNA